MNETTTTVHTAQCKLTTEQLAAISEEKAAAQKAEEKALDRAFKRFGRRQRGAWGKLKS